jgi:hypothetical protein
MRLRAEGQSLLAIREHVDKYWGDTGPSTDTPKPPADLY